MPDLSALALPGTTAADQGASAEEERPGVGQEDEAGLALCIFSFSPFFEWWPTKCTLVQGSLKDAFCPFETWLFPKKPPFIRQCSGV